MNSCPSGLARKISILRSELEFGSYLTYCPHGSSFEAMKSLTFVRDHLKTGRLATLSAVIKAMVRARPQLPFADFFANDTVLVPVPGHAVSSKDSFSVTRLICGIMHFEGLCKDVADCLRRTQKVAPGYKVASKDRPTPEQHYATMAVETLLPSSDHLVLVDDVVTRGATFIAAASLLSEVYPRAAIQAFALVRTQSTAAIFSSMSEAVRGTITNRPWGTFRDP